MESPFPIDCTNYKVDNISKDGKDYLLYIFTEIEEEIDLTLKNKWFNQIC